MQWSVGSYEMPPPRCVTNAFRTGVALIVAITRVPIVWRFLSSTGLNWSNV